MYTLIWYSDLFFLAYNLLTECAYNPFRFKFNYFPFVVKINLHIFNSRCHLLASLWVVYAGSYLFPFQCLQSNQSVEGMSAGLFQVRIELHSQRFLVILAYHLPTLYHISSVLFMFHFY